MASDGFSREDRLLGSAGSVDLFCLNFPSCLLFSLFDLECWSSVQLPVQNTCSSARNVRFTGHKYDDRRLLSCAHRPSAASLFSKNLACIPQLHIRPGTRSKSTLSLGRVGGRGGQDNLGVWTTITLWQSGMRRPQPVEISHDARTIRGDEKTLQVQLLLSAASRATVHDCSYFIPGPAQIAAGFSPRGLDHTR